MSCTGCECCAQAATMRVEIAQLTESGVAMVDRWDEECKAHARTRQERDGLREEVARLTTQIRDLDGIDEAADVASNLHVQEIVDHDATKAKLGQAVAALRDAVKHCRQCNGIGKYWPHCDACADSTCDHECPPQRLCGVCAEWRAILADPDSSAAGEAHAEVEELIDIWLRLRVFICPHETDNGLMCAECGDEQSKLANELESISAAIDARRRRGEVAK